MTVRRYIVPALLAGLLGLADSGPARASDTAMFRVPDQGPATRLVLGRTFDHAHRDRKTNDWIVEADAEQVAALERFGLKPRFDLELTSRLVTWSQGQAKAIPGFSCYRTVAETNTRIDQLVAAFPTLATAIDIGDTWRKGTPTASEPGFDLRVLKLTNAATFGAKPKMFVMSGLHAREYTPVEVNLRFAEWLLDNHATDATARWLLDHNEFHLLLQANPDGRIIAEQGLSQRKNRRDHASCSGIGEGVDLNRNFLIDWGGSSSSGSLCNELYRGTAALSEPESAAVNTYIGTLFPDTRPGANNDYNQAALVDTQGLYLDMHSFSQVVIWPWGFPGSSRAPNHNAMRTLGRRMAWFNNYSPEQSSTIPASGASDDNAYGTLGVPAYTFELGTQFFQDCTTFTNSILPDNLEALRYGARILSRPYVMPGGPDARAFVFETASTVQAGVPVTVAVTIDDTRFNQGGDPNETPDAVHAITAANLYIDELPWAPGAIPRPMAAADGSFNQTTEVVRVTFPTDGLSPGDHLVFVQGIDSTGTAGPPAAGLLRIVLPTNVFADGFE